MNMNYFNYFSVKWIMNLRAFEPFKPQTLEKWDVIGLSLYFRNGIPCWWLPFLKHTNWQMASDHWDEKVTYQKLTNNWRKLNGLSNIYLHKQAWWFAYGNCRICRIGRVTVDDWSIVELGLGLDTEMLRTA